MIELKGLPTPNPGSLPGGNLGDYVIQEGKFAGMTVSQAQQWAQDYAGQVQGQFGQEEEDGTDQLAGYVGGLGAVAGGSYLLNNGIGTTASQIGNLFGGAGAASTGAASTGAAATGATASGFAPAAPTVIPSASLGASGAGAASTGAATTGTGAGLGIGGGSTLGALGALGAGAATGYLQGSGVADAIDGQSMTLAEEAALFLPTFGLSFAVDPLRKAFSSKKAAERKARVGGRDRLGDAGLFNNNAYTLADGSGYDIAQPGNRNSYILDHSQEGVGDQVGAVNALTLALLGNGKVKTDLTGELVNAYNSDGNFTENLRSVSDRMGGRDAIYGGLANAWKQGAITANERDAGFAAIDKQYGIENTSGGRWEDSAGLSAEEQRRNQEQLANREQELAEKKKKHEQNMAWYEKDGKKLRI